MRALALVLALAAMPALAQTPTVPLEEAPTVVTLKVSAVEFGEAYVVGDMTRPDGSFVPARSRVKFRNLIELRGNFRPELARSASKLP